MLPLLIGGALLLTGAAAGIYAWLADDTNTAREEYNRVQVQIYNNINELRQQVDEVKRSIHQVYDPFKALMPLYVSSIRTADAAYKAKNDIKLTINSTIQAINKTKSEMQEKYATIQKIVLNSQRQPLYGELSQLKQLKQMLYEDLNNSKNELKSFTERVLQFNHETHDLKEYIGHNCGEGGKIWYERKQHH